MGNCSAAAKYLNSSSVSVYLALPVNPKLRAASTALSALVPRIVQSHLDRNSFSGTSTPKLSNTIRRQAGTQEKRVSCLWKGSFDVISVFLSK